MTSVRDRRTRSVSVVTFMPSSAARLQAGTRVRAPSTSTTQTRQALTGVRLSAKQSVGVSTCWARHASRMVEPSGTRDSTPSTVIVSSRRGGSSGTAVAIYDS